MATAAAKESYFHPYFDDATADVLLQSSEGTLYRVHSFILRNTSGFFRTMLSLPQPIQDDIKPSRKQQEIHTGDSDSVMERVLRMMCGLEIPRWESFDEFEAVLELIEKWDTPGPLSFARTALPSPMFSDEPLRVYILATRFGWQEETASALVQTLKLDLLSGEFDAMLCRLSSRSLLQLVTFHDRCKARFRMSLDGTDLFAAGNEEPRECSCGKRRDNYPWRILKAKIISEFNRRPLGDRILVDMAGWPESAACWRAKCHCGNMYYDQVSTVANIKACITAASQKASEGL
ncbi:BTB domain-containing protein [Mycena indigotica]|uniref:BTB domain-containing protein n=1 Tax=Mycena indigotica TaxID=2126181 RepID=A0A8H6WED6_9AGAR|nr:BTB domain-containing protein [Mycena indigotica]KAF7309354.1 BTB domain-containing protein [Mycena indigotica]